MALLISTANLKSTDLAKNEAELFVVKLTCDSSYATGGYNFHPDYYAPFHPHDVRIEGNGGYEAAWDRSTNKLLVTRGGNECVNGTDLTGIEFVAQIWKYGKFAEATLAQTTPIQTGAAGPYLKNNTDDSISSGTTTWASGTTLAIASGATQTIAGTSSVSSGATQTYDVGSILSIQGATIREGTVEITADNQNIGSATNLSITSSTPATVNKFSGGVRDGQVWHITATAAKAIYDGVSHSGTSNILLPGNVDFTTGDGDEYQLRYDETAGKYLFEIIHFQP